MTIVCLPISAVSGSPLFSAQQTRQAFSALMTNGTARRLGAASGRRPGLGLEVSATTSTWTVQAGSAVVDAAFSTAQGPYLFASNAITTGSMTPADGTNPRVDIVFITVSDDPIDSSGLLEGDILYDDGTPNASPVAPSLPARSFLLATINVPRSGAGSPTVVPSGFVAVGAGGITPVASAAARDAQFTNPWDGQHVYRMDVDYQERFDGTAWNFVSPPLSSWFGTPGIGSLNTAKRTEIAEGRISGTSDSNGLFQAHTPVPATCILKAEAYPELGAATDCYNITRWPESSLTGGPGGTGQVTFQHRLLSSGAAAASKAYLHSFRILYQA